MSRNMWGHNRLKASTFIVLMMMQVFSPIASANIPTNPQSIISTSVDLELMEKIGLKASGELENGWFDPEDSSGEIDLLFRQSSVVGLEHWVDWTDSNDVLDGWYILTHSYPIPTEWKYELADSGIDCHSYMPPNGFHCRVNGHTIGQLDELNVQGIVKLDSVDKVREELARGLLGINQYTGDSYLNDNLATVNIVLSGDQLPIGIQDEFNIKVHSHSGRFTKITTDIAGIKWLAEQGDIEWIEPQAMIQLTNSIAESILNADDVKDSAKMVAINSGWNILDGSGIVVAVADSGLDSGVNDATMHADFADHIKVILSWPRTNCAYTSPGVPGPSCDDGAEDTNGHGTHVAGSVLGDGTSSLGSIKGIAPEAQLVFQAINQGGSIVVPDNYDDMFKLAVENGSKIHTNSWGGCIRPTPLSRCNDYGLYTTDSMQIDESAYQYPGLVIMFAAGNDGADLDSNGEMDDNSLLWQATAKNSITIGASENNRPSRGSSSDNSEGVANFSARGPTEDGRVKPDFVAPGTQILSTKSGSSGTCSSGSYAANADYCYMSGTSMATPLAAGTTTLLLEHLIENRNVLNPPSSLIKAIYGATTTDMTGQFSSSTIGAGEATPNLHEGLGRINLWNTLSSTFVYDEPISTGQNKSWVFSVPNAASDLQLSLAYTDPAPSPGAGIKLVNDLDIAIKDPSGMWTHLSDNLNNLRNMKFSSPMQGFWEVHIIGTSVPNGPQLFSLALNHDTNLVSSANDLDADGVLNINDDCTTTFGTSTNDRKGCPDDDGDGYSNPESGWTTANGADAFILDNSQWADQDVDGFGDNPSGNNADDCVLVSGISITDRNGCIDSDSDGYSDPDDSWTTANGADSCINALGNSTSDRNGCLDGDGDGFSDPDGSWNIANGADAYPTDKSQWADQDDDGFGDNPSGTNGDNCPSTTGTSYIDRNGCTDTDGDNYSDPGFGWTIADGADAFQSDPLRWLDTDGDGLDDFIDDDCPNHAGTSSLDRNGCPDIDGDGYSESDADWNYSDGADVFTSDATQWNDTDSDGYGDEPTGNLADDCPTVWGDSWRNGTLGCLDSDQDGWADQEDAQPNESTQWIDQDGDGYGDNLAGLLPDACPGFVGNSTKGNRLGCPDKDGDGWDDTIDQLSNASTQWLDQDGDGYGDNATGIQPDACPGIPGNSTIDRYGCVDNDGDGISNASDSFPDDPTRSQDTDSDGYDDLEDKCIDVPGNSTIDRIGCRDTDGDGFSDVTLPVGNISGWNTSDGADAFPLEKSQWNDTDGDGYGDNSSGFQADDCPTEEGYSNINLYGCPDADNDGTSQGNDSFPNDASQWNDSDGDGFGDNPNGTNPDSCISVIGTSTIDRYGCPDEDGDGASDINDLWLGDATQWFDTDGDGFGDQANGTMGDGCPQIIGTADKGTKRGCIDSDEDGWADLEDEFPTQDSQWLDTDGDGWGDNQTAGSFRLDHWPNDPTKNAGEAVLACNQPPSLNLASGDWFSFTCTISTEMSNAGIRVEWQSISAINADTNVQALTFTNETTSIQTISFAGNVKLLGDYNLVISAKEPGSEIAMDIVSLTLKVEDSRIVDEELNDQTDTINKLLKMPLVQAALGGLMLFVLVGALIVRGKASKIQSNIQRREHAEAVLKNRINNQSVSDEIRRVELGLNQQMPQPPPEFR
jgi:hypothetical protein